jgi:hypothetical protein
LERGCRFDGCGLKTSNSKGEIQGSFDLALRAFAQDDDLYGIAFARMTTFMASPLLRMTTFYGIKDNLKGGLDGICETALVDLQCGVDVDD